MKKILLFVAASFVCSSAGLYSQLEQGDWALEETQPFTDDMTPPPVEPEDKKQQGPFAISANYDFIGKAKFDKDFYDHQSVAFQLGNVTGSFIFYYDECHKEGVLMALGYTYANLDWKQNPFFDTKNYNQLNITLGAFSARMRDWFWKAAFTANIDMREWDTDYTNYDITLWGRYDYCRDIGLHIGFIAQTGMKMDRVYPIIGFDWKINTKWKLNAVFPVDMSLAYYYTEALSVGAALRPFDYRNRAGNDEPITMAIFRYQSLGSEFFVSYDNDSWITANLHAGAILGGHVRVATWHNKHPKRLKFNSAPYAGGAIAIKF